MTRPRLLLIDDEPALAAFIADGHRGFATNERAEHTVPSERSGPRNMVFYVQCG